MVYIALDGKKKHFDSIKTARAKGLKICYDSHIRALAIYNEDDSLNGEIVYDFHYESGYAYGGYKDGKYFYKPLYKDGSVGPNKYPKRK